MRVLSTVTVFVCVLAVAISSALEQPPELRWTAPLPVFAGSGSAVMVALASGSGYAIAGPCSPMANDTTRTMIFLAKTDLNGKTTSPVSYFSTFPLFNAGMQEVKAVVETYNGDFIIAGNRMSADPEDHRTVWIARVNPFGKTLWTRFFGKPGQTFYQLECAMVMKDGGIAVGGSLCGRAWVSCINNDGTIKWSTTCEGERALALRPEVPNSISSGVVATCISSRTALESVFFNGIDLEGKLEVSAQICFTVEHPELYGIVPAVKNIGNMNTLLAQVNPLSNLCQVMLYNESDMEWEHDFSLKGDFGNTVNVISALGDGSIVVAGDNSTDTAHSVQRMWMTGMSKSGTVNWESTIPFARNPSAVLSASDHGFVVCAKGVGAKSGFILMKFDAGAPPPVSVIPLLQGTKREQNSPNSAAPVFNVQGRLIANATPGRLSSGMFVRRCGSASAFRAILK